MSPQHNPASSLLSSVPVEDVLSPEFCVLQVLVRSDLSGDAYGSVLVDGEGSVGADLLLDNTQQHVYALTSSRVRQQ